MQAIRVEGKIAARVPRPTSSERAKHAGQQAKKAVRRPRSLHPVSERLGAPTQSQKNDSARREL